jgi:hypothetical protein
LTTKTTFIMYGFIHFKDRYFNSKVNKFVLEEIQMDLYLFLMSSIIFSYRNMLY